MAQKRDPGINNDFIESPTHSFVIKIWEEDPQPEADEIVWRGHITHVISGKRQYFQQLDRVLPIIKAYLQQGEGNS